MEPDNFWTRMICSTSEVISLAIGLYYLLYKSNTDKAIGLVIISLVLEKLGDFDFSIFSYFYWHYIEPKLR